MNKQTSILIIIILLIISSLYLTLAYEKEIDAEGNYIIKVGDEEYHISSNYEVENQDDTLTITNNGAGADEEINIEGMNIKINKDSQIKLIKSNEGTNVEIIEEGSLTVSETPINNIKNGKFKINNEKRIVFAEFEAINEETYIFNYEDKTYEFKTKEGGKVLFNPEENEIKGTNVELDFEGKEISGEEFSVYLDGRDISNEHNAISITKEGIEAKGKVKIETKSFIYEGLTDSTTFTSKTVEGKEMISIDGSEDKSLEEGGIAKFTKKFKVGNILKEEGFLEGEEGIATIISREEGKMQLTIDEDSINLIAEIDKDPTKFALINKELNLELGNKEASFIVDNEFGMVYEISGKKTEILSPRSTHFYLGNDIDTVKNIVKSQITSESYELQKLGIQKVFDLEKQEGFKNTIQSFEKTKDFIHEIYNDELQESTALATFMLENFEQVKEDFTYQTDIDGNKFYAADPTQKTAKENFIKDAMSEIKNVIESQDFVKDFQTSRNTNTLMDALHQKAESNPEIIPSEVKNLFEKQFENILKYEGLRSIYDENYDASTEASSKKLRNNYEAIITLEETKLVSSSEGLKLERDSHTFSTKKLNYVEALSMEFAKHDNVAAAITWMDKINTDYNEYVKNLATEINPSSILTIGDDPTNLFLPSYLETISNSQGEQIGDALTALKQKIDSDKIALTNGAFNKIQLDLFTQEEEIQNVFDVREGYSARVRKAETGIGRIAAATFGGGIGKDIVNLAGGYDDVIEAASVLQTENQILSKGTYGIQSLHNMGVGPDVIDDWVNNRLNDDDLGLLVNKLLIASDRAVSNPKENLEYQGQEVDENGQKTGRVIESVGGIFDEEKYSFNPYEQKRVLDFLKDVQSKSKDTYYSESYGDDIQKMIGAQEIGEGLSLDNGLQKAEFERRIGNLEMSGVGKVINFIDDGLSPGAIAIGAVTGGIGGTFFSSATGLTGAGSGIVENIIIDGAIGSILVSADVDIEKHPYIAAGIGLGVSVVTGIPRSLAAIGKTKTLLNPNSYIDSIADTSGLSRTEISRALIDETIDFTDHIGLVRKLASKGLDVDSLEVDVALSKLELKKFSSTLSTTELDAIGITKEANGDLIHTASNSRFQDLQGLNRYVDNLASSQKRIEAVEEVQKRLKTTREKLIQPEKLTPSTTSNSPRYVSKDIINREVAIPRPQEDSTPYFNREKANEWVESALDDPKVPDDIRSQLKDFRRTIVDNVEHVSQSKFEQELKSAVDDFSSYIGDEPYVVVLIDNGGSEQWAYEIASQSLKNKPEGFAYLKAGLSRNEGDTLNSLEPFFDKGIRKVVIFDDAAYSGTGITTEAGLPIAYQYKNFVAGKGGYDESPMEYIAVVSRASDQAVKKFHTDTYINNFNNLENTPMLIYSQKMKSINQITNWDSMNPKLKDYLEKTGFQDYQSLTFYDHKVPDHLSLPPVVSNKIFTTSQPDIPIRSERHNTYEPYKRRDDFYDKWQLIGTRASVIIELSYHIILSQSTTSYLFFLNILLKTNPSY